MRDPDRFAAVVLSAIKTAQAPLLTRIAELETRLAAMQTADRTGPQGEKGIQGDRGEMGPPGPQGEPGQPGASGERGDAGIQGPQGELGPPGPSGRDGRDGLTGQQGEKGLDGKDGLNGKDGRDGSNGKDGLGFDDFEEELNPDGRTIIRRYRSGDRVKEFRHVGAWMLYRDVWKDGTYQHGDVVTRNGSMWHCNETTTTMPDTKDGANAWTLCVKHGRDGKPGESGKDGLPGRNGKDFIPDTLDGRKYR